MKASPMGPALAMDTIYNRDFYLSSCVLPLRGMHTAAARTYGWDDLDLGHGYHEHTHLAENDRTRFTLSEAARAEVIRRLSELNRQRYDAEVKVGLHDTGKQPQRKKSNDDGGEV